jgi:GT2 family glycosyltransferase
MALLHVDATERKRHITAETIQEIAMHGGSPQPQTTGARPPIPVRPRRPLVSVIVVNYNGKRYLDDCLSSLAAQDYPRDRYETIVVDNGSSDGSVATIRARFPTVRVIPLRHNRGFAAANNEGFRQAKGEYLALLNNDTLVDRHWLSGLVDAIGTEPTIGATTSKILFKDDPSRINNVGLMLYPDGSGADRGYRQRDEGQFDEPAEVFGACGASVLLRRAMLEDVGCFDECLFMYYEDLDLFWRARMRGWKVRYTPQSVVYHVHCGSSVEWSPFFHYHVERNRVLVNWKNAPLGQAGHVLASFSWRALRKWARVAMGTDRTSQDWGHALAYGRAALSLLVNLPRMSLKRWYIRRRRRTVPDRAFAHLIYSVPASGVVVVSLQRTVQNPVQFP